MQSFKDTYSCRQRHKTATKFKKKRDVQTRVYVHIRINMPVFRKSFVCRDSYAVVVFFGLGLLNSGRNQRNGTHAERTERDGAGLLPRSPFSTGCTL
jgi:hypothetical protein